MAAKKKTLVAVVVETTPGVLEEDSAADALGLVDASFTDDLEQITRQILSDSLTPLDPLLGKATAGCELTLELKGSGVVGTAPESDALLQATFGGKKAIVGGTVLDSPTPTASAFTIEGTGVNVSVGDPIFVKIGTKFELTWCKTATPGTNTVAITCNTLSDAPAADAVVAGAFKYYPVSSGHKTVSVHAYLDGGIKFSLRGAIGTVKFADFSVGASPKLVFTMEALDLAYAASTPCPYTPTINRTLKPAVVLGQSLTLDGVEEYIRTLEFDLGMTVTRREAIQAASGTHSMEMSERGSNGSIDPYLGTSIQHFTDWKGLVTAELVTTMKDALTPANVIALHIPRMTRTSVSLEDADGVYALSMPFSCGGVNGDDEAALVFCKLPS